MSAGWLSWTVTRTIRNTRSSAGVPLLSWGQLCTAESHEASAFTWRQAECTFPSPPKTRKPHKETSQLGVRQYVLAAKAVLLGDWPRKTTEPEDVASATWVWGVQSIMFLAGWLWTFIYFEKCLAIKQRCKFNTMNSCPSSRFINSSHFATFPFSILTTHAHSLPFFLSEPL